jgi:trk system potassium uptake protein TrkA
MGLRIAILGLGDYGSELAKRLVEMRAEVIAVDKHIAHVQAITPYVNKAVVADITRRRALEEAGVDTADVAVIATAERFEATVLAAHHLREFQVPKVIAKVANTDQSKILKLMGVAQTINPEIESADRTAHLIAYHRIHDYMQLGDDVYLLRAVALPSFVGLTVDNMRTKYKMEVIARKPADQASGFKGVTNEQVIAANDELLLVGTRERCLDLRKVK